LCELAQTSHKNANADKEAVKAFPTELQTTRKDDIQQSRFSTRTRQDIS
jgi:hypothetical protein